MKPYFEIPSLKNIYLEDSFILGIEATKQFVTFTAEFVLTEEHEYYSPPLKGEQHCYKKGKLKFENCKELEWLKVSHVRYIDKNLEIDMGNIDVFTFDENKYSLSGDWGEVEITCEKVSLDFCTGETEKGSD
jgi:hypothetical protein